MPFLLDPSSSEPLYRQLRRAIEDALAQGRYRNAPLPSSRALAMELGISRTTVNLAYQELVAEGFIYSEPRSGYRINREFSARLPRTATQEVQRQGPDNDSVVDWDNELRDRGGQHGLPEIVKDPDWADYPYPFVYGQVHPSTFPTAGWTRALRDALVPPHDVASLADAGSADDAMLIEQLCLSILPQRGITASPDEVLVTFGTQHGLHLAARALLRRGDIAAVENPGYPDAAHIFERAGAAIAPVDVDQSGLVVRRLPRDARLVLTTPSHQFPTNVTLSVARCQELIEHARRFGSFIIEDDYDSEFRHVGRPGPALRASGDDRIVYLGSFSKFLAPGLRLGYVVAAPPLIAMMRRERRYSVRHPAGHSQRALALLIEDGTYQRSLKKRRVAMRRKWRAMVTGVREILEWEFVTPTGGTSIWAEIPVGLDPLAVAARARSKGVLIESGATYHLDQQQSVRNVRLGYSAIQLSRIEPGLRLLRRAADELRDEG